MQFLILEFVVDEHEHTIVGRGASKTKRGISIDMG